MNPGLDDLQPYPFERLRTLFAGIPTPRQTPIRLSIGEPQHPTPEVVRRAIVDHLEGLSVYPTTAGLDQLREVITAWFVRRYRLPAIDAGSEVLPVNGTREALFAFAQAVLDGREEGTFVACPNPFYQIYEGAAILAGARPAFLNQTADRGYALNLEARSDAEWRKTRLLFLCTPGNPTGRVMTLDEWRAVFDYSDRYGFIVASDECYSEIYPDEEAPPIGGLEAAHRLGRTGFPNLVVFSSLSKRSNAPGLRSGAVAGDRELLRRFLLYRTYHGCAMSLTVQHASIAAWTDEAHVAANRTAYREKFRAVVPLLAPVMDAPAPEAGFYLWARVPGGDDERFARELFARTHVTVLPGRYLAREAGGGNPGHGRVRIALVPELDECADAAHRIVDFCRHQLR